MMKKNKITTNEYLFRVNPCCSGFIGIIGFFSSLFLLNLWLLCFSLALSMLYVFDKKIRDLLMKNNKFRLVTPDFR